MIRWCDPCGVAYDDAVYLTLCPHGRVDGAYVEPLTILATIVTAAAYLESMGLNQP